MPELEDMDEVQGEVHTNNTPGNDEQQSAEETNFPPWIKILSRKQQRLQNQAYRKTLEESRRNDEQPPPGKMPTGAKTRQTSKPQKRQLPPLPIEDYKVVVRPLDGLNLGAWGPDQVYRAIKLAAKLTPLETAEIKTRLRKDQNLAVVSTPSVDTLERLCNISSIALGEKQFRVKPYAAMPDDSCKGVISGLTSRPSSEWLTEELNARNTNYIVLNARMMGSTTSAIITFHGLRVPRLVYIDGGEFECRVYRPKKQVCTKCLGLGHREDVCPQPEKQRCPKCGTEGSAMDSHECEAKCVNCCGAHPATDPRCPARQRAPYNKSRVQKYLQQQQHGRHQQGSQRPQHVASPLQPGQATQAVLPEEQWPRLPTRRWANQNPYALLASETLDSSPTSTGPQAEPDPGRGGGCSNNGRRRKLKPENQGAPVQSPRRSSVRTQHHTHKQNTQHTFIESNPCATDTSFLDTLRRELREEMQSYRDELRMIREEMQRSREELKKSRLEPLGLSEELKREVAKQIAEARLGISKELDHMTTTLKGDMQTGMDNARRQILKENRAQLPELVRDILSAMPRHRTLLRNNTMERDSNRVRAADHLVLRKRPPSNIRVWQWNCRGYRRKRGALTQFLATLDEKPEVIAMQETACTPALSGYVTCASKPEHEGVPPRVATLVAKHLPFVPHQLERVTGIPYVFLELLPQKNGQSSLFVLNLYSSPRARKDTFDAIFRDAIALTKPSENTLLIVGDLNAAHPAWGYYQESVKGRKLATAIDRNQLTLLNEPDQPTRVGNSASRDTCPDLSLARARGPCTWTNLQESLGSDHFIIQIQVPVQAHRRHKKALRLVNWDSFRQLRAQTNAEEIDENVPLAQWVRKLHADIHRVTKTVQTTDKPPVVDPHLLHLWEARRGLTKRWRRQKHNRKLKIRIAKITQEAERYAEELTQSNWHKLWDKLQGTLGTRQTWSLLKSLLDPTKSRTETNKAIIKLVHQTAHNGENALWEFLKERYIASGPKPNYRPYPHEEADHPLDQEISEYEVRGILTGLTRNSAPGEDGVTYRILRNLDDASVSALTSYFNRVWSTGVLPPEWKHAEITFIPKPGKALTLENLRPISLTSCIGKLLEHIVLRRLQSHLEANGFLGDTMFGFRQNLSAQDVLLQLKEDILDFPGRTQTRAVLALDLRGAFDNVSHDAILEGLTRAHCGKKTYDYVRAFLTDRTATLGLGDLRSQPIKLSGRGTPQGSVLSPTLFNIAISSLPTLLGAIPNVRHALYADDITIWTSKGSDGEIQDGLQEAVEITQKVAEAAGLTCAADKSELLLIRSKPCTKADEIYLNLNGEKIPTVDRLRVLGLHIQSNGKASFTVQMLRRQCQQIAHLIRRVGNGRGGLKEADTVRIVQALLVSRVIYHCPFHNFKRREIDTLNTILRTAIKTAVGLPQHTSTQRLLRLGIHNTIEELIEAQAVGQRTRLSYTQPGRNLLARLGYKPLNKEQGCIQLKSVPPSIAAKIRVLPLPKNMHPTLNAGRRLARTRYLRLKYQNDPDVCYTDAGEYTSPREAKCIVVCDSLGRGEAIASLAAPTSIAEAEEAAIALAVAQISRKTENTDKTYTIITDSQPA
ncbi:uncharacterized protein LOC120849945 [Ixodes scapularis]|uniref:uncharacterized protein LOC120849945 n=1 Tax=Ixodes scapularis TaxID=6945 RepID=UPI001C38350C|nr:uncharacterized protein LOC120849945 [Ixodes scapularis]